MHSRPSHQRVLSLPSICSRYQLLDNQPIPAVNHQHELLVRTETIGLNPIDWKAPDYGFGIPVLPYIAGRELVGYVDSAPTEEGTRLRQGQRVAVISTDYRDVRKAAYQEYAVASSFNVVRLPDHVPSDAAAAIGVAFVTGALALGVCAGLSFEGVLDGPDLLALARGLDAESIPRDIRDECLHGIQTRERPKRGDWLAIWGGSSTCAFIINQLARLSGLRTILILDARKHARSAVPPALDGSGSGSGSGSSHHHHHHHIQADLIVDSHDPARAVEIVRAVTDGRLRFAIDVVGSLSAAHLAKCLLASGGEEGAIASRTTPPSTPPSSSAEEEGDATQQEQGGVQERKEDDEARSRSHLVGLTGLPKTVTGAVQHHAVPVKLFHEVPEVGDALVGWLERLLDRGALRAPRILGVVDGLEGINDGLDRMRRGEISGGRLVARLR